MMTIIPGKTPCLRCLLGQVPSCSGQSCRESGVLGPAVAAVAAFEASEALKILSGNIDRANPNLVVFDFWSNIIEQVDVSKLRTDCPCCVQRNFEFLEP
jgi:adenylyltransferase/sulfurtransferase